MDTLIAVLEFLNRGSREEDLLETRICTHYLRLWGHQGLWPLDESQSGWLHFIYPRCVMVVQSLNILLYLYSFTVQGNTFIMATEQATLLLFITMGLVKNATYVFQPMRIKELCSDLEWLDARRYREGIPEVNDVMRKARLFSKMCYAYVPPSGLGLVITTMALLTGKVLYTRRPLFSAQYPCDVTSSPCLELTMLNDVLLSFTTLISISLADIFFVDILNHVWSHTKILNLNLTNIRKYAVTIVDEQIESERSRRHGLLPKVVLVSEGAVMIDVDLHCAVAPRTTIIHEEANVGGVIDFGVLTSYAQNKARKRAAKNLAIDREMKLRLAECVRHHQAITRLVRDVQTLYYPFLLSQMANNLVESAIIALHIILVPSIGVKELGMSCISFMLFTIFFAFSWISNAITSECSKVKMALYNSDWLETTDSFKRSMRIIISRSNKKVVIRVANSVPLSLLIYRRITKTSVSNFLTMRTIANKK